MPVRVLIVDDSAFMRRAISRVLGADADIRVVGQAANGEEGVAKVKELRPDVVVLDLEMPVLDGMATLRRLRAECGDSMPAVIVFSGQTADGSHKALQAMRLGAADVIGKVAGAAGGPPEDLVQRIKAVGASRGGRVQSPRIAAAGPAPGAAPVPPAALRLDAASVDVVVIGSSTGGPPALEEILTALPPDLSVAVVVAQHMPPLFTRSLAERLDALCAVGVVHGASGMPLLPGSVYIAPGGRHTRIIRLASGRYGLEVSDRPEEALYKPSVNELFASGARAAGSKCLAVVLTGMGDDGREGARAIRDKGGKVIAQDAASCVVYGMPRAVVDAGLASAVGPPRQIAAAIASLGASAGGLTCPTGPGREAPHPLRAAPATAPTAQPPSSDRRLRRA